MSASHSSSSQEALVDNRLLSLCAWSLVIGGLAGLVAKALTALIGFITAVAFYGKTASELVSPAGNHLGLWVVLVPAAGGVLIGLMARYGSAAIRGDGIPEVIEKVLADESRIAPRITILKPLSAAIAMGTGCPFGAEGPIIATGGALGSVIGQLMHTTAQERKVLLSAGAAAGIAGIFGCPVAGVLFAVELLLFEFSPRSLIPVALASAVAGRVRVAFEGSAPIFAMPQLPPVHGWALACYLIVGLTAGAASVVVNEGIEGMERAFEKLPVHWMWWPALGGVAVGLIGYVLPRTMGVGYDNIADILSGTIAGRALIALCVLKAVSWTIALGSGTSGGTLAPLFTIGGGLGGFLGGVFAWALPHAGVDPRMAALVGMAAIFAGASRALLGSIVFAFEATLQAQTMLPLLAGCAAAYLISIALARHGIMTHKVAARGVAVPHEFQADPLSRVRVREVAHAVVTVLRTSDTVQDALEHVRSESSLAAHQGFPVVDGGERLVGLITRHDLDRCRDAARTAGSLVRRPPVTVSEDALLREAVELMVTHKVGRLPVVSAGDPDKIVGILTRSNVLAGYRLHLEERRRLRRHIEFAIPAFGKRR